MAIAAPARRSDLQTAPSAPPADPPEPKKRPRDRPRPGGPGRSAATASVAAPPAPKRKSGGTKRRKATSGAKAATVPKRKSGSGGGGKGRGPRGGADASPIRKLSGRAASAGKKAVTARASAAPSKKAGPRSSAAPAKAPRRKVAPRRRPAGVIPIAAGAAARSAVAVTHLPESGLIHRLTRGRAWIGVLGVLLVGIVALNVVTLSFAASAGKIDGRNQELSRENSVLQNLAAQKNGQAPLLHEAKKLGLATPTAAQPQAIGAHAGDVATAAQRLVAAAGGTAAASGEAEAGAGEGAAGVTSEGASAGAATGEETAGGEEVGESGFSPEEEAIYNREYEELLASEGGEVGTEEVSTETTYEEAGTE